MSGKARRERRLEIVSAVLMALATVATAWCAYQSAEWGGEQAFLLGESQRAGREASLQSGLAAQQRAVDAAVFMEWIGAVATGNDRQREFYEARFPDHLAKAVEAWRATGPLSRADAPPTPFAMAEYKLVQEARAAEAAAESANKWALAREYDANGDRYVLLTVLFASVLFFAGIAEKFESGGVQVAILVMGSIMFAAAFGTMLTYPVWL